MPGYVPPGMVRLRCVTPANHWDCPSAGHQRLEHDANNEILVERGPHAEALLKAGYIAVNE